MKFLSPSQSRAARGLLNWSQPDLAERCGMHVQTISQFEQEVGSPTQRTLQKITETFEQGGIEFLEGEGVRKNLSYVQRYYGIEGFRNFMDDVYETSKKHGGELCLFNTQPSLWLKYLGKEWYKMHTDRMGEIQPALKVRIAIREGDDSYIFPIAQYRWIPKDKWKDKTFYAYGPKLGLLNFKDDENIEILVINESEFADSFRVLYEMAWQNETIPAKKAVGA